jgi:hypothetical protein
MNNSVFEARWLLIPLAGLFIFVTTLAALAV